MKFDWIKIKPQSFWFYQITGWLLFCLADTILVLFSKNPSMGIFFKSIFENFVLFSVTILLRLRYRNIVNQDYSIIPIIARITAWSIFTVCLSYCVISVFLCLFSSIENVYTMFGIEKITNWVLYVSPVLFGWSALYFGIRFWADWNIQKNKIEKVQIQTNQTQLQILRNQLNPQFVFNSLNSVKKLIDTDKQKSQTIITELSEFLRYSLMVKDGRIITFLNELNATKHYLAIKKILYWDQIQIEYEIDPAVLNSLVPSHFIYQLVEYITDHKVQNDSAIYILKISAKKIDKTVQIVAKHGENLVSSLSDQERLNSDDEMKKIRTKLENVFPSKYQLYVFENQEYISILIEIPAIT
jgi:two-component system, LytTR family, sensor kinase